VRKSKSEGLGRKAHYTIYSLFWYTRYTDMRYKIKIQVLKPKEDKVNSEYRVLKNGGFFASIWNDYTAVGLQASSICSSNPLTVIVDVSSYPSFLVRDNLLAI
jgi:hypothetical protein